jgi:hypothetical protein
VSSLPYRIFMKALEFGPAKMLSFEEIYFLSRKSRFQYI